MADYMIRWRFKYGAYGWSETWYCTVTDADGALAVSDAIIQDRMNLCGFGCKLEQVNVRDVTAPWTGKRQVRDLDPRFGNPNLDIPTTAVICKVRSGTLASRTVYLRGVPDDWVIWSPAAVEMVFTPEIRLYFDTFMNALADNAVKFRAPRRDGAYGTGWPITEWTVSGDKLAVTATGMTGSSGDVYLVRGVKGFLVTEPRDVNRRHRRLKPGPLPAQLDMLAADFPDHDWWTGGKIYPTGTALYAVDDGAPLRIGTRKAGKAIATWKGRVKRPDTL